jgi:hypothetical protein
LGHRKARFEAKTRPVTVSAAARVVRVTSPDEVDRMEQNTARGTGKPPGNIEQESQCSESSPFVDHITQYS